MGEIPPPQQVRVMPGDEKRGLNACLVGCIGGIVIALALTALTIAGGYYLFGKTREAFTSPEPRSLPDIAYTQEEAQEVLARIEHFEAALQTPGTPAELVLNDHEINILLRSDPRLRALADKVHVQILDETIVAELSVPLDVFPGLGGRYLNGLAELGIEIDGGRLKFSVEELIVRERPVTGVFLYELESTMNQNLNADPDIQDLAKRIEEIDVQDGHVRIRLRGEQ